MSWTFQYKCIEDSCTRALTSRISRIWKLQILLNSHDTRILLLTVTGDDVNNQTLNTRDEFGIEIIVEECDGYLGRGRIALDLWIPNLACGGILWRLMSHQFSVGY